LRFRALALREAWGRLFSISSARSPRSEGEIVFDFERSLSAKRGENRHVPGTD
jgi:hypothetical protein